MATREDVLDAIDRIEKAGGAGEATRLARAALTLPLPPSGYDRILADLGSADPAAAAQQQGLAALAMKRAEVTLAQQLSRAAEFDRKILEALLRAHKTTVEGRGRLDDLELQVADAARAWDLSTAAGAREFQRFLIAKLGEIIMVVEDTNDDDTSKQALAAALTVLYAAQSGRDGPAAADHDPEPSRDPAPPVAGSAPAVAPDPEPDPYLDLLADDEPGDLYPDAAASAPQVPSLPTFPGLGADGPGFGAMPAGMAGGLPWGALSGLGREDLPAGDDYGFEDAALGGADADADDGDGNGLHDDVPDNDDGDDAAQDAAANGPVMVRLPDGQMTVVADPRLAAAIQAVADGRPVIEAFRSQGMHIPPPGTPVPDAVDVSRLRPGDIGVFTDRHALAVGDGKALLDGQVHLAANMRGPGFLGWQHPPIAAQESAAAEEPAPTRPAAAVGGPLRLKNPV
ncbi:DUF4226 domain-containing protein [Mycolicibacter minnesotensis]